MRLHGRFRFVSITRSDSIVLLEHSNILGTIAAGFWWVFQPFSVQVELYQQIWNISTILCFNTKSFLTSMSFIEIVTCMYYKICKIGVLHCLLFESFFNLFIKHKIKNTRLEIIYDSSSSFRYFSQLDIDYHRTQ